MDHMEGDAAEWKAVYSVKTQGTDLCKWAGT